MSANITFINGALIKSRTGISDAIDDKQLKPQIKIAQDMYVQGAVGSTLYLRLQTGVSASNLNPYETILIDTYITDCLLWYTMSLLPLSLGYQFFSKGILQKTSEESNTPSRGDLELLSSNYKQTAEFYKQRLINYLRQNYSLFAEYIYTGSGYDVIFPEKKAYTSPMFLGSRSEGISDFYGFNGANSPYGIPYTVTVLPSENISTFSVPELSNKSVLVAVRSGLVKGITTATTSNTLFLQINNSQVTLPTGDLTVADEVFIFTYR